ncbi:MAG: transcription antitermination factor NusB [Acidimicrobiales bacterium]
MADRPARSRRTGGRGGAARRPAPGSASRPAAGSASRRVAIEALVRIDEGGAYANLVLPEMLDRTDLGSADRHFVTELVYGTTRARRACDHLVDRFLLNDVEPEVRAALRVGAYQLAFLETPPHAALDATVGAVRGRGRSVVNAVLRRVAAAEVAYPDRATALSYPDWIVDRLDADLGPEPAEAALRAMNRAAVTAVRDDGYVQDPASQLVAGLVDVAPGQLVLDLCAAPGGKATALAGVGATVVAGDLRSRRLGLVAANATRLGVDVATVVADGTHPPFRPGVADRVLIDAPCAGLGSLRRRPDARWRIDAATPERLARLQVELVVAGFELLAPGGILTYSVCTLTSAEGAGVAATVLDRLGRSGGETPELLGPPGPPWLPVGPDGAVGLLIPGDTDGMLAFRLRRPGPR